MSNLFRVPNKHPLLLGVLHVQAKVVVLYLASPQSWPIVTPSGVGSPQSVAPSR
jgi:hypothetical protein